MIRNKTHGLFPIRIISFPLLLEGVLGLVTQETLKPLNFGGILAFVVLIPILSRLSSSVVLQQGCKSSSCTADCGSSSHNSIIHGHGKESEAQDVD